MLLAAGLKGIEEGYELPAEADSNLFEMSDADLAKLGIEQLPPSLSDALKAMERSPLVAEALGDQIFEWFLRNKRSEWRDYKTHVSWLRARSLPAVAVSDPMDLIAVYPDPPPPDLARTLDLAGYRWKAVSEADVATRSEPAEGWAGAVIAADVDPEGAWGIARALRKRDRAVSPLLVLVSGGQLPELELRNDLFDDFCLSPFHPVELEARLRHLFWREGGGVRPEMVEYGALILNLETYQATIADAAARPHVHGVRAAQVPGAEPRQGVHARDAAVAGVGLRVLRRRAHGRRPHPAAAGEARRGAGEPDPDRAQRRLPVRAEPLGVLTAHRSVAVAHQVT